MMLGLAGEVRGAARREVAAPIGSRRAAPVLLAVALAACAELEVAQDGHDAPAPDVEGREQALYFGPPGWANGRVPVCFPGHQPSDPYPLLIRWILEDTWSSAANVSFVGFDDCSRWRGTPHVEVTYVSGRPHATALGPQGSAATQVRLPFRETIVPVNGIDRSYIRATIIHEFGHALGFIHEQQRPDFVEASNGGRDPTCPANFDDLGAWQPVPGGSYMTPIDRASIMSYCDRAENLSEGDRAGVARVYGAPRTRASSAARSLLWHANDGRLSVWLFSPANAKVVAQAWPQQGSPMRGATVVATGDFDGNGLGDVLWRANDASGSRIWLMNSGSVERVLTPGDPGPGWQVAGAGDFDRDGSSDIVWVGQGGGLLIDQASGKSHAPGNVLGGWSVVGVADYDGDRAADLLLRNASDVALWRISTGAPMQVVYRGLSSAWRIAGSGDFDGNGRSDVLLVAQDGNMSIWYDGGLTQNARQPGTLAAGWFVAATGDFDANGFTDILVRSRDGQNAVWPGGLLQNAVAVPSFGPEWNAAGSLLDRAF